MKESEKHATPNSLESETKSVDRRTFVKLVPALGAAVVMAPHVSSTTAQVPRPSPTPLPSPSPSPTPLRVNKDMLRQAEKLIGIEFTDAQEAMALNNASSNLERYETLRKIDVPLDTEPATLFHPALPGKKFNVKATRFRLSKTVSPSFTS